MFPHLLFSERNFVEPELIFFQFKCLVEIARETEGCEDSFWKLLPYIQLFC